MIVSTIREMQMLSTAILLFILCSVRPSAGQNNATFSLFVSNSSTLETIDIAVHNALNQAITEKGFRGISNSGPFNTMVSMVNKQMTLFIAPKCIVANNVLVVQAEIQAHN